MYFNDNIAKKYGFAEAILLQSIYNWCSYNKRNNKNNFDNRFWMFNTNKEFLDELPYLKNINTIRTALKTLKDEGLILTGNYNNTCTRTTWYSITDKALEEMKQSENIISEVPQNDMPDSMSESNISENNNKECDNQQSVMLNSEIRIAENNNTYLQKQQLILLNPAIRIAENSNITNNITTNNNTIIKEREIYKEKERKSNSDSECLSIFDFWNASDLLKCSELTPKLKYIISCALKRYTSDQIKEYIRRYKLVLKDESYYFSYLWSLKGFLTSQNGICDFADDGEKWLAYNKQLEKPTDPAPSSFIHNNYTKDQLNDFLTDLDFVQI